MSSALDALLAALPDARRSGSGWTARCPAHEDRQASLSVGAGTSRGVVLTCFTGCQPDNVVRRLGLDPAVILGAGPDDRRHGAAQPGRGDRAVVTVAALARVKGLPESYLRQLGLRDAAGAVEIPYRDTDDRELFVRRRLTLTGKNRTMQPAGVKLRPYGLDRLAGWADRAAALMVEGESDCWAGWHHGVAVLGIPGAAAAGALDLAQVAPFSELFVVEEPDTGGASFGPLIRRRLDVLGWPGTAYAVQLHHGGRRVKDLADLHLAAGGDRSAFWAALAEARKAAVPLVDVARQPSMPATADWPEPASLLGIPSAPVLDLALFPPELANVALDASARIQCPPDYIPWALVAVVAGLIGPRVRIRPRQRDDWTERACFWPVLIGEVSWMKTPAIEEARRPLIRQETIDRAQHEAAVRTWEETCDLIRGSAKRGQRPSLPSAPLEARRSSSDGTIEKLAELIASSPGMTMIRDEIAGLVGSFNRYAKGEGDRQFWLECYSGGSFTVDRIGRGTLRVADLYLNLLGGTQPDRARELFGEGPDDGFAARVTGIYPEQPSSWREVDRYPDQEARRALNAVCDRLAAADWSTLLKLSDDERDQRPYVRFGPDAGAFWSEWHGRLMSRLRSGAWDGRRAGRAGKYPGVAARLALIWHLVDWAAGRVPDDDVRSVPRLTLGRVLDLMDQYTEPMDDRLYAAFDQSTSAGSGQRIARWIVKERPTSFTLREIRRHRWSGLSEPAAVENAVEWLAAMGWVRESDPEQRRGRPANRFDVNPRMPMILE